MTKFKIYTTKKVILDKVASDFNLELAYLKEHCGEGYVSDGKYLRVFIVDSHVDLDLNLNNFTESYLRKQFLL